jgi:hypothetical protein
MIKLAEHQLLVSRLQAIAYYLFTKQFITNFWEFKTNWPITYRKIRLFSPPMLYVCHTIHICVSGEDEHYRASELNTHGPTVLGWQSARECSYPQELILQLHATATIHKIQVLAHQYLIRQYYWRSSAWTQRHYFIRQLASLFTQISLCDSWQASTCCYSGSTLFSSMYCR